MNRLEEVQRIKSVLDYVPTDLGELEGYRYRLDRIECILSVLLSDCSEEVKRTCDVHKQDAEKKCAHKNKGTVNGIYYVCHDCGAYPLSK